jgi:iron complex transport system substrate-binding protein
MRIASLLPSATEIVCALGLQDDLVAVTHECDYPESVRLKPVVTSSVLAGGASGLAIDRHVRELVHQGSSIYALDAERLAELRPDLILTQELCEVCAVSYPIVERAARRLDAATQLISLEPQTLEDVFEHHRLIGRLAGRGREAERVIASLQARVDAVRGRLGTRPPRSVVTLEWIDPPYNCGHWTTQLIELAGGRDLLGNPGQPARPIAWEQVIEARPEVVVVAACGFSLERSLQEVEASRRWLESLAPEVWVVDGNAFFSRPGPRLVDSVELMGGMLHPDLMGDVPAAAARRWR